MSRRAENSSTYSTTTTLLYFASLLRVSIACPWGEGRALLVTSRASCFLLSSNFYMPYPKLLSTIVVHHHRLLLPSPSTARTHCLPRLSPKYSLTFRLCGWGMSRIVIVTSGAGSNFCSFHPHFYSHTIISPYVRQTQPVMHVDVSVGKKVWELEGIECGCSGALHSTVVSCL